jgi:hypothetical protein
MINTQSNDASLKGNTSTTDTVVTRALPNTPMPFQTANGNLITHETAKHPFKTPYKINPHAVNPPPNPIGPSTLILIKTKMMTLLMPRLAT